MKLLTVSTTLSAALFLAGCVTINIYFPASAAEKAADKIIDEIWQPGSAGAAPAVPPPVNDKPEKP
ncbi:exported protein of unknown function [Georgfuchsia toluolica]|uniref:Lipoprotein n=1 Tax=Georgfuchsia toluolica TaxID=424218 RepID=A0A916J3P7_9PROT|nr:hypothetical protein [Georgfuchsia toluolica]CAG4883413.1 exported protein of unknown function [Georgfuchsia toluolica]